MSLSRLDSDRQQYENFGKKTILGVLWNSDYYPTNYIFTIPEGRKPKHGQQIGKILPGSVTYRGREIVPDSVLIWNQPDEKMPGYVMVVSASHYEMSQARKRAKQDGTLKLFEALHAEHDWHTAYPTILYRPVSLREKPWELLHVIWRTDEDAEKTAWDIITQKQERLRKRGKPQKEHEVRWLKPIEIVQMKAASLSRVRELGNLPRTVSTR